LVPFSSAREFETALARERRWRTVRLFGVPALLALLTFGANAAWRWRAAKNARTKAAAAWSAYSQCVLGAPLRAGERPSVRMRRIEMNLPEAHAPSSSDASPAWPARCAHHLDDLSSALVQRRLTRNDKPMAELLRIVEWARKDPSPPESPDLADDLWASIDEAGLLSPSGAGAPPSVEPASDAAAPPPAEPLTALTLPPLPVEIRVAPEEADHLPADGLRLLFAAPSGDSTLCSFRPDERGRAFETAHCADNVVPTSTDDATPGFLRNIQGRFDKFELIRPLLGADPQIISMPTGTQAIALFADQLLWITGRRLFARTVPQGTAELGPPFDLGDVAGSSPELAACRSESSLVVRVRSYDDTGGTKRALATVAIRTGDAWERAPKEITCRAKEATFTALDRNVIRQARCTPEGCAESASDPLVLPWDSGRPNRVSDVDGSAILVGIGMTAGPVVAGSVKTVRMRLAKVEEMARAHDTVLLGDLAHEGVDVTDVRVYVRRGAALLLVTSEGKEPFRAMTVSKAGAFEPLHVTKL
jgi:hypothetical protein